MPQPKHKVLVLGASGMLGNAVARVFQEEPECEVYAAIRNTGAVARFPATMREKIVTGMDVENFDSLLDMVGQVHPTVIINCIGVVKQLKNADDPLVALPLNSLFPHRLARLAKVAGARLIHVSTDCVFDGSRGGYKEADTPNAKDLYGRSKLLGEVDYANAVTIRTSIVGHELTSRNGLIDWFLSQDGSVQGFRRAVFSGLTTVELALVIARHVIPREDLRGVYHVSAEPITKYDLLSIVANVYQKDIKIIPDDSLVIDRSLNSERFRAVTGYSVPDWPTLIKTLREFYAR